MNSSKKIIEVLREVSQTHVLNPKSLKHLTAEEQELIQNLYKDNLIDEALSFSEAIDVNQNWQELKTALVAKETPVVPLWRRAMKYAAILVVALGCLYLLKNQFSTEQQPNVSSDAIELVLENGDIKIINVAETAEIANEKGELIGSQEGDILNYNASASSEKLVYNQLKVPYGKTFNIVLSDGTKVYLNSGTSLKYPINFITGNNREVFLEGEAYFEVAKDKAHPFIVNANNMNIEVLGTQFNVSSYPDDSEIHTVLVEGSVSLSSDIAPNNTSLLIPGFKGSISRTSPKTIVLEEVDTKIYTEWMNGDVIFRNSTFKDMVKKLARNYNVTIENNYEALNQKRFNASFNRKIESIDDIMTAISEIYPFTYSKTGNQIIINP